MNKKQIAEQLIKNANQREQERKLLPCPFCGNEDIHMSELDDEDDRRMWVREIECETCQLKMRDWSGWNTPFNREYISEQVRASLTKMWNRRS